MFENKTIAITGATGFLGRALIKEILKHNPKEIRGLGHSENKYVESQKLFPQCTWLMGSITDSFIVGKLIQGVDIVIHAAAQKHIPIAEKEPSTSININVVGTFNLLKQCVFNNVEVVGISTDKACNPQTVYGMSKYLMERIFFEHNSLGKARFYCCRYGNVAGSSGSVFEIWNKLGKEGKTLQLTDPDMTRFYFTVEEAVDTIITTLKLKCLEKPVIPTMKAMRMGDVAEVFSKHYGVPIKVVGNRGNEKQHEQLTEEISSDTASRFDEKEIRKFLRKINLLK